MNKKGRKRLAKDTKRMKELFDQGETYRKLARRFRVSLGTAYNLVNGADRRIQKRTIREVIA